MISAARHSHRPQWVNWVVAAAILALAALLRFWALGRPDSLVFDELYYVRDAVSQLAHGYPTTWPDDDPAFGGERARAFSDHASTIAHPPLGKWLIGLGVLLLGPDTGWGWRFSVALAGVATVGATMRLGYVLSRSRWVAWLAGLVLAIDGVHVVLSRVSLLDGFLTCFVVLGALCVAEDWRQTARRTAEVSWRRPWLLGAGACFGAAAAVKWSGLYPLAAFLLLLTLGDLLRRWRRGRQPLPRGGLQALVTAAIALPAAVAVYLSSWIGWIITPGGQRRHKDEPWPVSLWKWHLDSFEWHSTLTVAHPFQSHPIGWPIAWRPTAMYGERAEGMIAAITPVPNPFITWAGVLAVVLLGWVVARAVARSLRLRRLTPLYAPAITVSAFVLTGYLSGWLPWVLTFSRSAVFQFYAVVLTPFSALALALTLAAVASLTPSTALCARAGIRLDHSPESVRGRRIAVAIFLVASVLLAAFFMPLWVGEPIEAWFHRLHLWLPEWS